MESYIPISFLNDFIFCPRSIYFHQLYGSRNTALYQQKPQIEGKAAHNSIDKGLYTTRTSVLQGTDIYSEKYKLCGKIDLFDKKTGKLWERKREITTIYDGYIFQVYAQYHCLTEMGFHVKSITIYDLLHNRNFPIPLPQDDDVMHQKFEKLIEDINQFDLLITAFEPLKTKCDRCIYANLCDLSLC